METNNINFNKPKYNPTSWVIPGILMRSSRPGYPYEDISPTTVNKWLSDIYEKYGIVPKTIITFLSDRELMNFYRFDLLQHYSDLDIDVYHMPTSDPVFQSHGGSYYYSEEPPFTFKDLQEIKKIIQKSKKPVLIHCSAGIDRTGQVAKFMQHVYNKGMPPNEH